MQHGVVRPERVNWSRLFLSLKAGDSFEISHEDWTQKRIEKLAQWHSERWNLKFEVEHLAQAELSIVRRV